ncbi:hypothetical protein AA0228_1895 [Gluconobacter frateurii NRIC 0228]|uniref:Uncharacterized protein n=1 Tax=Gluconobacter frateurii NRIC 0228 TaxID=1307946 RepID=A0ABQ0QCD3_9PROT|nr:hypothetical protein AA0228_1895 [Gluconobacter frateurii NRIC 0228]
MKLTLKRQDRSCLLKKLLSCIRQGGAPSGSREKLETKFSFKSFDLLAQGGLLNMQSLRSLRKASVICDGDEVS